MKFFVDLFQICWSEILFHNKGTAHTGPFHNWISVFRSKYYLTKTSCLEKKKQQNKQKQTTKLTEKSKTIQTSLVFINFNVPFIREYS